MARARMLKPEFFTDPKIGRLSREARLLFPGLWVLSDDDGNVCLEPAFLRANLFAFDDDITLVHIDRWIAELVESGRVRPYRVSDERYGAIINFGRHQRINRPSNWRNPAPVPLQESLLDEDSRHTHDTLTEDSWTKPKPKPKPKALKGTPIVEPDGSSESAPRVSDLVAFWVEECRSRGYAPPRHWRNACGNQVRRLIAEKPADLIRSALRVVADERKQPGVLAHVVVDLEAEVAAIQGARRVGG